MSAAHLNEFLGQLRRAVELGTLVKLTLGAYRGADGSLRNLFVRPVALRAGPRLSFLFRHKTKDITKNLTLEEGLSRVAQMLGPEFGSAHLFTLESEFELQWPAGGEPRLDVRAARRVAPVSAAHDRTKHRLIEQTAPWLHGLGVTTAEGKVREGMAAKFRQINRFVEILGHCLEDAEIGPLEPPGDEASTPPQAGDFSGPASPGASPSKPGGPSTLCKVRTLRLVDMGCGKGYLTFAAHDWLRRSGWAPDVRGVEARSDLVDLCRRVATDQRCEGLRFEPGTIAEAPLERADVLVALHACDTATDDAIAKGIRAGASLILVAPCCHRELRPQLRPPRVLAGALRHGIFRERQAEFLTDALRAALLEWAGYEARVFEFIATEHTAKNLMIAAVRRSRPGRRDAYASQVRELAAFGGIRSQSLARQLGFDLLARLESGSPDKSENRETGETHEGIGNDTLPSSLDEPPRGT